MRMKKRKFSRAVSLFLAAALLFSVAGCAGSSGEKTAKSDSPAASGGEKIVNIGVTDALRTLNPLLQDGGELNKYATGLLFLPLVELDSNLKFQGQLAESVTTDDNLTFTVKLRDNAVWSDGKPVTADDVIFTVLRLTNKTVGNTYMAGYSKLVGFSADGFSPDGAESVGGLVKVDDHTVKFVAKEKIALPTFENSYLRYLMVLPKHILGSVPVDKLANNDFFNKPSVVSGPFTLVDFDKDHYISYQANKKYFLGAPKIDKLNIKIVQGSQLYAGLKSGEIDFVQQTTGVIPQEDYQNIQSLENVKATLEQPLTNELVFINNKSVPNAKVRQAILYAINREQLVSDLLKGSGEVVDGFLSSYGPYYDSSIKPTKYDPEKAKALVKEAGWDSSKELNFLVNSGDTTLVQAGSVIAASLAQVGIKVKITTVDFNSLFAKVQAGDFDLYAIQYTVAPIDPSADMQWLVGTGNYLGYSNKEIDSLLTKTQQTKDDAEFKKIYSRVDTIMQQDVPLFSAYVVRSLGACSKRLVNAEPHLYGTFLNVEKWEIKQ